VAPLPGTDIMIIRHKFVVDNTMYSFYSTSLTIFLGFASLHEKFTWGADESFLRNFGNNTRPRPLELIV
jgi:hypothetical protein